MNFIAESSRIDSGSIYYYAQKHYVWKHNVFTLLYLQEKAIILRITAKTLLDRGRYIQGRVQLLDRLPCPDIRLSHGEDVYLP